MTGNIRTISLANFRSASQKFEHDLSAYVYFGYR
jgi:hypothetical protein